MRLAIISGKGGVGKTLLSINLSVAFAQAGHKVLLVDANFTAPTIATYFNQIPETHTIDSVIGKEKFSPTDLVWIHPAGFYFLIPSFNLVALDDHALNTIFTIISPLFSDYDIVILDGPAGVGRDVYFTVMNADAALIVANPTYASLYNALKTHVFVRQLGKPIPGAVLNRYDKKYGITPEEASEILELPILGVIPEDKAVKEAVKAGKPLLTYAPNSKAAQAIYDIAEALLGKKIRPKESGLARILRKIKEFLLS